MEGLEDGGDAGKGGWEERMVLGGTDGRSVFKTDKWKESTVEGIQRGAV